MEPFNIFIKKSLVRIYGTVAVAVIEGLWLLLKCTVRVSHVGRPTDYAQRSFIECSWHAGRCHRAWVSVDGGSLAAVVTITSFSRTLR